MREGRKIVSQEVLVLCFDSIRTKGAVQFSLLTSLHWVGKD